MDGEEYDRLAEKFYRDTGIMAPGKDVPAALAGMYGTREERREKWESWLADRAPDPDGEAGGG